MVILSPIFHSRITVPSRSWKEHPPDCWLAGEKQCSCGLQWILAFLQRCLLQLPSAESHPRIPEVWNMLFFFTFLPLSFHPFLISQIAIVPMNFTCIIYFFVWLNLLNNHDFNIEQSNCGYRASQVFKIRTEHRRGENSGISDTLSCKVVLNL